MTEEENKKVTLAAAGVESDYYCQMCRVEETIEFAKRIGSKEDRYRHLCRFYPGKQHADKNPAQSRI